MLPERMETCVGQGQDPLPQPCSFRFVLQVAPLDFLHFLGFLAHNSQVSAWVTNQNLWGLLPDDLLCEAPFSLLFTVLIPPVLDEDSAEIYLQDPVTWGLNWYKYLLFNISELTLIDWWDFYPFLAFIRHLFRPQTSNLSPDPAKVFGRFSWDFVVIIYLCWNEQLGCCWFYQAVI